MHHSGFQILSASQVLRWPAGIVQIARLSSPGAMQFARSSGELEWQGAPRENRLGGTIQA
jgi:hypothetical protein